MPELVTVVTSSWQRPQTLLRACQSVDGQTYPDIEHVVVIDGDDPDAVSLLARAGYKFQPWRGAQQGGRRKRVVSLGRNWSSYSGDGGYGAVCRLVGAWLGAGEYIAYLDDDVVYYPRHIEAMMELFEPGVDFVTSTGHGCGGTSPPGCGRTDTSGIVHTALSLAKAGGFRPDGYESDGHMVERFMAAGLQWRHKDVPSFGHPEGYHHGQPLP